MFDGFRKNYDKWYRIFREYSDRFVYATDTGTGQSPEKMKQLSQNVLRFLSTDDEFDFNTLYVARGIKLEKEHLESKLNKIPKWIKNLFI
jgi:hypothetical protein